MSARTREFGSTLLPYFAFALILVAGLTVNPAHGQTTDNAEVQSNPVEDQSNLATVPSTVDVITYHYNNSRTGANLKETVLTHANVKYTTFGKKAEIVVDGKVDAQPLYLSQVTVGLAKKNILYVATEHATVYALDADSIAGTHATVLWKKSLLATGETTSDDRGCGQVVPEIGITATPVIDRTRNAIYVVAMSKHPTTSSYFQRLHALNLSTGQELFNGPKTITATYGTRVFDPAQYKERPGLLQVGSRIYTTWSSHCDISPYTSWLIGFSADTLAQATVYNVEPNGSKGGIWMSGTAPAADSLGNVYFLVGNGTFETTLNTNGFPQHGDCGNCFVKIASSGVALADYFTMHNTISESNADQDLGSGGVVVLPDLVNSTNVTKHLAVGAGKDGVIYVVDRGAMGRFNPSANNVYQEISGQLANGVYSGPAFFNNTIYYAAYSDSLKAFPITHAKLAEFPSSHSTHRFSYPGATPSVSANGTTNAIVWAVDNYGSLHAFDAANLNVEFYSSNQAPNNRDHFHGNKFITPVIVNGKVFVGTPNSIAMFGLLP